MTAEEEKGAAAEDQRRPGRADLGTRGGGSSGGGGGGGAIRRGRPCRTMQSSGRGRFFRRRISAREQLQLSSTAIVSHALRQVIFPIGLFCPRGDKSVLFLSYVLREREPGA